MQQWLYGCKMMPVTKGGDQPRIESNNYLSLSVLDANAKGTKPSFCRPPIQPPLRVLNHLRPPPPPPWLPHFRLGRGQLEVVNRSQPQHPNYSHKLLRLQQLKNNSILIMSSSLHSALKLEKSAISKVQKHIICIFKNGKK